MPSSRLRFATKLKQIAGQIERTRAEIEGSMCRTAQYRHDIMRFQGGPYPSTYRLAAAGMTDMQLQTAGIANLAQQGSQTAGIGLVADLGGWSYGNVQNYVGCAGGDLLGKH